MEVRDDVVGVGATPIDAGVGEHHAGDAADGEEKDEPSAHSIGTRKLIEPPHMVAIHEKIFTPVGTAITMVRITK